MDPFKVILDVGTDQPALHAPTQATPIKFDNLKIVSQV
jgi:hypothetical protein